MQVSSRKMALRQNLPHYFTGRPCRNGHLAKRHAGCGTCIECGREKSKRHHRKYPEKQIARVARYAAANPDYVERNRARINRCSSAYRKRNPALYNEAYARRRAALRNALPSWLTAEDRKAIRAKYEEATRLSVETGEPWEVDHIVPLRGKGVSGLHVPRTLQVIPRRENRRKSNKFITTIAISTGAH
jgi:hypothetical protein